LAAILRKTEHLVLTLVGGGVFGNPIEDIAKSIAHAHQNWSKHSSLQTVRIPIYSVNAIKGDVNVAAVLSETLQNNGVAKDKITILYEETPPVDCV
jgi:O-acetyl-ADP-ribose deacetylase (regulator of RNase III)